MELKQQIMIASSDLDQKEKIWVLRSRGSSVPLSNVVVSNVDTLEERSGWCER